MTAHRCTYRLWVNHGWICTSKCHYGQPVQADPPGLKPAAWPISGGRAA